MPTGYPGSRPKDWKEKLRKQSREWKKRNRERQRLVRAEWRRKNQLVRKIVEGMGVTYAEARELLKVNPPDKNTEWYRFWFEDKI